MRPSPGGSKEIVSVLVPSFNGSRTIEKTLKSVLAQDHHIEVIVVDDASSDGTADRAKRLLEAETSKSYRLIQHQRNLGLSATINHGLSAASGRYVLVVHQDCELLRPDWISLAVETMKDRVAVVTGYYGIPDKMELNIAKKTFGLMRRQIHPRPQNQLETVNFSEGKCDLYDRKALDKIGGFPTRYRITGEDLSISIILRNQGYSIVKNYELPVAQRFGGKAESISGNIRKEFEFGQAMGGVVEEHRLKVFSDAGRGYSRARTSHRISQVLFTGILTASVILYLILLNPILIYIAVAILIARYGYYAVLLARGLRTMGEPATRWLVEAPLTAPLGVASDIVYALGFVWGLLKGATGSSL